MKYSLVLIGAHDGVKTESLVKEYARIGQVLLIEPVPFLYTRLKQRFLGIPNIQLGSFCISDVDGISDFFAPLDTANSISPVADQLGSLNPLHAVTHHPELGKAIEKISVITKTFQTIIQEYNIESIDLLFTDTEGFDAKILLQFPFEKMMPRQILFEYKHSDGTFHIGRNFGALLILLDVMKYKVRVLDVENCLAEKSQIQV